MQNYQIMPIAEQHIESFRDAVGSVARERKYLAFLDAPSLEMARAFVMENLREGWPHIVAVIDDKVVGWCDITSLHRPVFSHAGTLGIGILAPFRAQGIGEALMRAAIEKAQHRGLTRIELTVREHNKPAIALYEKLGFQVEGLHRNAVCIDGQYENHICMALLFDNKNAVLTQKFEMAYDIEIVDQNQAETLCRRITQDLPKYFGIPSANEAYFKGVRDCRNFAAKIDGQYAGLLSLNFPYVNNCNIYWMAVLSEFQSKGIGHQLIEAACRLARKLYAHSMTVETLAPDQADENYLKTWRFYQSAGFKPLFNLKPEGYEWKMVYMARQL